MSRFAALLLCTMVAAAVTAAPPPPPRAKTSGPWLTSWDKPLDPKGDCRFDRSGDKLTITLPGKEGPRSGKLLRDVEGDFVAQVRVGLPPDSGGRWERAGLVLTDGKQHAYLERFAEREGDKRVGHLCVSQRHPIGGGRVKWVSRWMPGLPAAKPAYLRLERRGDQLLTKVSEDGKNWAEPDTDWKFNLPEKLPQILKVGVIAKANAPGEFKAEFDHFKLTQLGGKTR